MRLSVGQFFRAYMSMHPEENKLQARAFATFEDVWNINSSTMIESFVAAINSQDLCPGFELYCVRNGEEASTDCSWMNPSVAMRKIAGGKEEGPGGGECPRDFLRWESSELGVEIRRDGSEDGFAMGSAWDSDSAVKVRAKLDACFQEHAERQQRTHFFQLLIYGQHARLLYYDRGGRDISESFDYAERPEYLTEFFWRYSLLTDEARGWDSSVELVTGPERHRFQQKCSNWITYMLQGRKNLPDYQRSFADGPTYKLVVPLDEGDRKQNEEGGGNHKRQAKLLIRRAFVPSDSAWGRATRGYLAWDVDEDDVLFMKDSWRISDEGRDSEAGAYEKLKKHGVPYLPVNLYLADVCNKNGEPQQTVPRPHSLKREETVYTHGRIIQRMALPLGCAWSSTQMCRALYHATICIQVAHDRAKLLHRDISINNVMIDPFTEEGILNDWDMSGPVCLIDTKFEGDESADGKAIVACRTGTWRYMSLGIVRARRLKVHTHRDDVQSIYWVLLHAALRYFEHVDATKFDWSQLNAIDTTLYHGKKCTVGGAGKLSWLLDTERVAGLQFKSPALQFLIHSLTLDYSNGLWKYRIDNPEYKREEDDDPRMEQYMKTPAEMIDDFRLAFEALEWPQEHDTLIDISLREAQATQGSLSPKNDGETKVVHNDQAGPKTSECPKDSCPEGATVSPVIQEESAPAGGGGDRVRKRARDRTEDGSGSGRKSEVQQKRKRGDLGS